MVRRKHKVDCGIYKRIEAHILENGNLDVIKNHPDLPQLKKDELMRTLLSKPEFSTYVKEVESKNLEALVFRLK